MSDLLISNWHAALAHFAIALLLTSTFFFLTMYWRKKKGSQFEVAGKWTLWLGTVIALGAMAAWLLMSEVAPHNSAAHKVMQSYESIGSIALVAVVLFSLLVLMAQKIGVQYVAGSVVVGFLVLFAGIQGGDLLYNHGVGAGLKPESLKAGEIHAVQQDSASRTIAESTIPSAELPEGEPGSALAFVQAFHLAMHSQRFDYVSAAFDEKATIFENGIKEPSLRGYLNAHLKPEMPVLGAADRKVMFQEATETDGVALVTTRSILSFSVKGKQHDFNSVETLALSKGKNGWAINHAHWSSRPLSN